MCVGDSVALPGGGFVYAAGTYSDTLQTTSGCDSIISLTVSTLSVFNTTVNQSICFGQSYPLPGGGAATALGTYYDTLISGKGCDSIITTVLSVTASLTGSQNPILCNGNSFTLHGATSVNTAGVYTDTVTSTGGCDSIITTTVVVKPNSASNPTPIICSNTAYTLPDGSQTNISGTYIDTVNSFNGCDSIITTTLIVKPSLTASVSPGVSITPGSNATLIGGGGASYNWLPATGLNTTTNDSVIASPTQTIQYCVEVTAANGCKDTACVTVTVELPCPINENLQIPNAFSPNNDNVNDAFCLQGWDVCLENFSIVIFDRWGEKVFESKDPNFCWDGKFRNIIMDAQVFVYYIKARFTTLDKPIIKKGNISLIR